jgi:glycosyltransferase involved in cell wall biosynthesis
MEPKISVIVPIYKAESTLLRCLDSLRAQTFQNFEVLMVDDGSPDKCGEMIDAYAKRDSRFKAFYKQNGGVSSARQFGIDHAQGEYTIHADPDDWVEPGMLEALYDEAKKTESDMVICDFYENTDKGQRYVQQKPSQLDSQTVLRELFTKLHGSTCNKLVRRSCYTRYQVQFPLEISSCEDQYVMAAILLHPIVIAYLPKAFYHYVRISGVASLSKRYSSSMIREDKSEVALFSKLLADNPLGEMVHNQKIAKMVSKAFWEGEKFYTSKEYKRQFLQYLPTIRQVDMPFLDRLLLTLSCKGFFRPTRKMIGVALQIKHLVNRL